MKFGPLMKMGAMRFESKHSCFKKCVHSSKNFINITKTLSEKHQLLQAYLSTGDMFNDILLNSAVPFHVNLYNTEIQNAIVLTLGGRHEKSLISDRIVFRCL